MRTKALVGVGAASVALAALLLAFPSGVTGLLDLTGERLTPPPELHLVAPLDGEGVGASVTLAGQALSSAQAIVDVQYRIDGGRWESAALSVRGQRSTPFEADVPIPPGDHVLEARAYDGTTLSLPARIDVRRDAPTVRIAAPADGAGVPAGATLVSGAVVGRAERVLLEVDGVPAEVAVVDGAWSASVDLEPGEHLLRATALGAGPRSLPHAIRVAAGTPPPPTVTIASPRDGSAYGAAGDASCGGGCILVGGTAERATSVRVDLDGALAGEAAVVLGAWSYRIPMVGVANGAHAITVRASADEGVESVPRERTFLARTPLELRIEGQEAPATTGTPLAFRAVGNGAETSRWTLDGFPAGEGAEITLSLEEPGDHVLAVQTGGARGRAASASLALHAVNRPPSISFQGEPIFEEGALRFDVEASDADGAVLGYRWDFGDGSHRNTTAPTSLHRYGQRGAYTATVTAIDDLGATASTTTSAVVTNAPPVATFDWTPASPTVRDVVTLRDASLDHDGRLVERAWTLPDGTRTSDAAPTLRLRERGPHVVSLSVLDDEGAPATLTRTIEVSNLAPEAGFVHDPALPLARQEVLFVDDTLDPDGVVLAWAWDLGDNTTSDRKAFVHEYREPGLYDVRLTVTDDAGATSTHTRVVQVLESPPSVRNVTMEPAEPATQDAILFRVVADDRDGDILAARWEFGDGVTADELAPTHRYARSGTYLGNVTVYDARGLQVTFPFHVVVRNAAPTVELVALPGGSIAAYPTVLVAQAADPDGRIAWYRFDADGDGRADCEGESDTCTFVYETSGSFGASVTVEDDEGATGSHETILDVALPPADHPPPTVRIESPTRSSTLRGEQLIRGTAEGPRAIAKVELQLRSGGFAYAGAREPWRLALGQEDWRSLFDTARLPDGDYELVVRATDVEGGAGFARIDVTLANGERPSDVTLQLVEAPAVIEEDVAIRASAFHPEGVTAVRYRVDLDDWTQEIENPLAFTIHVDRDALKPGEHVLQVEAYRGVREKATLTHVFTVPGVAPVLVVDVSPNPVAHALVHAEGRVIGEGRAQWRIDHGLWRDLPPGPTWNLTADTLDVSGGRHTLSIRAVSPDGRLLSEVKTWKIDVINPPFTSTGQRDSSPEPERAQTPAVPAASVLLVLALVGLAARRRSR